MSFSRIGKRMMGAIITASMVFSLIPGMMLFADTTHQINNTISDKIVTLSITSGGNEVTSAPSGATITVAVTSTATVGESTYWPSADRQIPRQVLVDGLAVWDSSNHEVTLTAVSGRSNAWTFTMPDSAVYITFPLLTTNETVTVPNNTAVFRSGLSNGNEYTFYTTKDSGDPYGYLEYTGTDNAIHRLADDDSADGTNFRLPSSASVTIAEGTYYHIGYGCFSSTATGNYTAQNTSGNVQIQFNVVTKQEQTISANDVSVPLGTTGSSVVASVTTGDGTLTYSVTSGSDVIQVNTDTGAITTLAAGTATVQIVASETTTYRRTTRDISVTVTEPAPAPQPDPAPAPQPDPAPAAPSSAPAGPTPEQIRAQLISNFVERLYIVALDRSYDVVGRDYWADQLMNQGNSGSYVAKGFFHSQEFLARDLSDEEFVTVLYSVFFDRTPDAEGFANWTNALANGATRDQVIAGFAGSPEWAATCARFEVNI